MDLSEQQALNADSRVIQSIFSGNIDGDKKYSYIIHYWRSKRKYFVFFTKNNKSTINFL